jgi:CRISPR-associated endonuclease/helicase Cas3
LDGFFEKYFGLLSGERSLKAYPWQRELFARLTVGNWPDSVALPTGTGKTSILKIWLLAFGWSLLDGEGGSIPRRLAWVVNRRVVVDQATQEAEAMAGALEELGERDELARALLHCSAEHKAPLAVSALRGQKADNREWSRDPLAPAIIVGTVDMIGSRLLFRGYRDGKYYRPYHAGLLGVDTLLVNDESHLTPAFANLLGRIAQMKPAVSVGKQFRVLFVSATERQVGTRPFDHDIGVDAAESERFKRVYEAEKMACLHEAADSASAASKMIELALEPGSVRTIVFVEKPEEAAKFAGRLRKRIDDEEQVVLLTGTMRGFERDRLSKNETFKKFQQRSLPTGAYYLVTTSAGEVGIDISGERMITLVRESDVLAQRLGRLNRFGDQEGEDHRVGKAHIIYVAAKGARSEAERRKEKTLEYLATLTTSGGVAIDVSCRELNRRPPPESSRSAPPLMANFDERLVELWSQTSAGFPMPAMPRVEHWLQGKQDEYPQTEVAWREEINWLVSEEVSDEDRRAALRRYRILPQETLKEPTARLREKLAAFADQGRKVLFQAADGGVTACSIGQLVDEKCWPDRDLSDGLLLFPPGCGWLADGMLRASAADGKPGNDVADLDNEEGNSRCRYLVEQEEDGTWKVANLGSEQGLRTGLADWAEGIEPGGRRLRIAVPSDERTERFLLLQTGLNTLTKRREEIDLESHSERVSERAGSIAESAVPSLKELFERAGRAHDEGKRCKCWQVAMGGTVERPLAKTKRAVRPKDLLGYRHELGSLLEALRAFPNDDLFLHLVASHHGWARPHWEERACHPECPIKESQMAALGAARRFSRLQGKWGPWGLAYLEALFKAADAMTSRQEEGISDA